MKRTEVSRLINLINESTDNTGLIASLWEKSGMSRIYVKQHGKDVGYVDAIKWDLSAGCRGNNVHGSAGGAIQDIAWRMGDDELAAADTEAAADVITIKPVKPVTDSYFSATARAVGLVMNDRDRDGRAYRVTSCRRLSSDEIADRDFEHLGYRLYCIEREAV